MDFLAAKNLMLPFILGVLNPAVAVVATSGEEKPMFVLICFIIFSIGLAVGCAFCSYRTSAKLKKLEAKTTEIDELVKVYIRAYRDGQKSKLAGGEA